jgi:oxygen-independent coproporphyrinogen-3 oxidase
LRGLRTARKHHGLSYNADFIAFGTQKLDDDQRKFFRSILHAKLFDSISLYTLELFPWSQRRNESQHLSAKNSPLRWDDDQIINEFLDYQELIDQSGYHRYEISNFSLLWKPSIHNIRYRNHGSYLWLGPSASSFLTWNELEHYKQSWWIELTEDIVGIRWKNPLVWERRLWWEESLDVESLDHEALNYEKIMLGLRTDHWISNLPEYSSLLTPDYQEKVQEREKQWLCTYIKEKLILTDIGMAVYNSILTELLK